MVEYARAGAPIPKDSSLPFGELGCIIEDGYVTDATVKGGDFVKITSVTAYNTLAVTAADTDICIGILLHDPAWGVAKGTAPGAGLAARVLVFGRVAAYLTLASAANKLKGTSIGCAAAGVGIPCADGKHPCAVLYDKRGADNSTAENIIMFQGGDIWNDT